MSQRSDRSIGRGPLILSGVGVLLGLSAALSGFLLLETSALGLLAIAAGCALIFFCKRGIHHTITQTIGLLLLFLGGLMAIGYWALGISQKEVLSLALGMMTCGFTIGGGRSGGWQGQ
ncbi:MAG: hypothetical protein AAGJ52_08390 [Pseudomonadota bacterium]